MTHVTEALQRVARAAPAAAEALAELLGRERWALWCTLYVDASNAGGPTHSRPGERPSALWAWGARGRIGDEVAALLGVDATFAASGSIPEVGRTTHSSVAELWGIAHALRETLARWPFFAGVGVRCDNLSAVNALAGCDGRGTVGGKMDPVGRLARHTIAEQLRAAGVLVRGTHVRGHGRADLDRQKAFNGHADALARQAAIKLNRTDRTGTNEHDRTDTQ